MTDASSSYASSSISDTDSPMPFVVFAGANAAANHLLELIRATTSSPALEPSGEQARYALPVPVWSTKRGNGITKWMIGSGAPPEPVEDDRITAPPDILLCPPGTSSSASSARKDIQPLHAALYFHPRSGGLVLENRSGKPIVYEGGGKDGQDLWLTKRTTTQTVLWKQKNHLRFGEHRFLISFVAESHEQAYIGQQFDKVIGCLYGSLPPSTLFNFAPKPHAHLNWYIATHELFPSGRLAAGIDIRTGQPLAVERVSKRKSADRHHIVTRLQATYRTDTGPQEGIMKVLDVWCPLGRLTHTLHHEQGGQCNCRYMEYSMPIAEHSFGDMPWHEVTTDDRIRYFRQTLVGLAKLHEMGIIHGHISPASLQLLTEGGRETGASDEDSAKTLKAVVRVCMRPTKVPKQSLFKAPELSSGFLLEYLDEMLFETGVQGVDSNEPVDAVAHQDEGMSLGEFCTQDMKSFYARPDNAAASVTEVLSNDAVELVQDVSDDADKPLSDVSDGDEWHLADEAQDLDGTEADVWALAMSWLSTLIALPAETTITKDIHSRLLDDLDAKTNSSFSTNEEIMALIIRDMLCWDPTARPSAAVALEHAAWSVIMMRLDGEEEKKRKRGGLSRRDSDGELRDKRARVVELEG